MPVTVNDSSGYYLTEVGNKREKEVADRNLDMHENDDKGL